MIRLRSLQQRFTLFILIPVAMLLLIMGIGGFKFARDHLLTQWGEATLLKLQRAAHHIDMRLKQPKELLDLFNKTAGLPHAMHIQTLILSRLKTLEGITSVALTWTEGASDDQATWGTGRSAGNPLQGATEGESYPGDPMMRFHMGGSIVVEPPRYDTPAGSETVRLVSELKDQKGRTIGQIRVRMRFDTLVDTVAAWGWWKDQKAFLVDSAGNVLAGNTEPATRRLGETDDPLERSTLHAIKNMPFGTLFGKGFPPSEISGFYTLQEAPWTLVIVTPGKDILLPILHFRFYYLGIGAFFIVLILMLIRLVTGRVAATLKGLSRAAKHVARGDYGVELSVVSDDEVGELTRSFNTMVRQLKERVRMKDALDLAGEVQQNLLPGRSLAAAGLEISGESIYCDETGGDYYDYVYDPESNRVGVAVGDVSGHGVAAALLMATVRAMIRGHDSGFQDPAGMITAVNRHLCDDTAQTGNFMTLFYLLYDANNRELRWVRAGHDPAMLYDPETDAFVELGGSGLALGVDENCVYRSYRRTGVRFGQVVLIGTDGIWEAENDTGERFGKDRLRNVIRQHSFAGSEKILRAVLEALSAFRQSAGQEDDITLVVVKAVASP